MPALKTLIIGTIAILASISIYTLIPSCFKTTIEGTKMSYTTQSNPQIPLEVHLSTVEISRSSISVSTPADAVLTLTVTLHNTSPQPISILRWGTPFDIHASAQGIFIFTSTASGIMAPSLELKINHKVPESEAFEPASEEIVKIGAGEKVERRVEVKKHEVQLEKGVRYTVRAVGNWMGVWVGDYESLRLDESSGILRGEFNSNVIEVET